ncbi:MAG: glycosyl hydrolase family 98, partial [Prevotella sp.]|nr:glycosyl hydrolase family 98 [Prevotella sp.]
MKRLLLILTFVIAALPFCSVAAQERRPIDNRHPLWLIHIDVWNSADPQKIIDLIPDDIKPYVCMNLSLSCQYDTDTKMYRMPRNAVRTYKSWASVCQLNNMWFTCQPASGGHTHIQDNDLETFEYFFKTYPNFLGWNYAEQFWGFNVANNESSATETSRWALFAKLVEMSHRYGGFLTVSWCGGVYHMNTNPIAELKINKDFMAACQKYPEAILFLYKYTHCSSFYNNESVCWGPFVSGLTKNYGVRYDNCGWNDALSKLLGDNHGKKYPGSAGIGTVMEQTCVNGGAVWDGPELIWTEDFQNLSNSTVNGYTRRNWGLFPNFKGIWLDMWRKIIDGTMYIPSREEVVEKTKIVVVNDKANDYTSWDDLYNGLYLQTD